MMTNVIGSLFGKGYVHAMLRSTFLSMPLEDGVEQVDSPPVNRSCKDPGLKNLWTKQRSGFFRCCFADA